MEKAGILLTAYVANFMFGAIRNALSRAGNKTPIIVWSVYVSVGCGLQRDGLTQFNQREYTVTWFFPHSLSSCTAGRKTVFL